MDSIISEVRLSFEQKANPEIAAKQYAYLKNKFTHFGMKTPVRREVTTPVIKVLKEYSEENIKKLVTMCFNQPEREFHQFGTDILIKYSKKLGEESLAFIKEKIETNSWWDTVDMLAAKVLANFMLRFPEQQSEMDKWIEADNMWLRRSAILYQLKYKDKLDEERLFRYCLLRAHETEFFIRKVMGWVLREYKRTNREGVEDFVFQNEDKLSNLSKREALR